MCSIYTYEQRGLLLWLRRIIRASLDVCDLWVYENAMDNCLERSNVHEL